MMKSLSRTFLIALFLVPLLGVSLEPQIAFAQAGTGTTTPPTDPCRALTPGTPAWLRCDQEHNPNLYKANNGCGLTDFVCNFTSGIGPKVVEWILQFVALFTGLAAALLNGVVYYTVVHVKENYDNLKPLLATWQVIRDLANMSFIFILLYAGIRTMLGEGGETRRIIVGVVIAAILMNFSLFFTRLVIDAANVLALTFYNAIAPQSLAAAGTFDWSSAGLATAFTRALHLQAFYDTASAFKPGSIITVGIMGSIMLLVAAFVFLAMALMFIIRYVVLLIVLILSPIFFLASAFPKSMGLDKYATQWKDALFGQAFFAPVFFLLIWISLRLLDGMMTAFGSTGKIDATGLNQLSLGISQGNIEGAFIMIINFCIVIALLLTSLSVAKQMANKAGGGLSKATDWATGKAGTLTFGAAGAVGRGTIGRAGAALGESETLKAAAARGGATGFIARQGLQAGRRTGSATFDARGAGLGGKDAGKAGGKGGYTGYVKDKVKEEEEFAKSLGASDKIITEAQTKVKDIEEMDVNDRAFLNVHKQAVIVERRKARELQETAERKRADYNEYAASVAAGNIKFDPALGKRYKDEMEKAQKEAEAAAARADSIISPEAYKASKVAEAKAKANDLKESGNKRKQKFADSVENSFYAKWVRGYNYATATKIRKGKTKKEQIAELSAQVAKEEAEEEKSSKGDEGGEKKEGEAPKTT